PERSVGRPTVRTRRLDAAASRGLLRPSGDGRGARRRGSGRARGLSERRGQPAHQCCGRQPARRPAPGRHAAAHLARRPGRRPRLAERPHAAARGGLQRRCGAGAPPHGKRRRSPGAYGRQTDGARDRYPESTRRGREAPPRMSVMPPILDEETVRSLLRMEELIPAMATALADLSRGKVVQPMRVMMPVGEHSGFLGLMPAYGGALGAKLVTFYPNNQGVPTHHALILLFRPETGEPLVTMDGRLITEMRTAAVSAVATKLLARPEASVLALLGSGVQAR